MAVGRRRARPRLRPERAGGEQPVDDHVPQPAWGVQLDCVWAPRRRSARHRCSARRQCSARRRHRTHRRLCWARRRYSIHRRRYSGCRRPLLAPPPPVEAPLAPPPPVLLAPPLLCEPPAEASGEPTVRSLVPHASALVTHSAINVGAKRRITAVIRVSRNVARRAPATWTEAASLTGSRRSTVS
jgi:hypothetical protein